MALYPKRLIGIALGVALLLLIPLVAMQFTPDVQWTGADFLAAGLLLSGLGLSLDLVWHRIKTPGYRLAIGCLILVVFVLVWLELAVGIFGTPFAGQ